MVMKTDYKQTEVGRIPEDWEIKLVGDMFSVSGGFSSSRSQLSNEGYCYLHYGDIHGSEKQYIDVEEEFGSIPKLNINLRRISPTSLLEDGDIVFVDASEDDEGASKHIVIRNPKDNPFISGLHTIVLKSKDDSITNPYKEYCFLTHDIRRQFKYYAVGTKVTGISKTNIKNIKVIIPPTKAEQTAIAAALSDADALISNLEELIAKKQNIKQGAMQQLLTGKKRLPEFTGEWEIKELCEVAEFAHGRGLSKADLSEEGPYRCIHYGQLFTTYKELIREVKSRTNKNDSYFYSKENDVLMPTSDVTPRGLATASCIKENGVALGGGILIIRFHIGYDGLYFSYFVTQNRTSILKLVKGSTVFHLYAADLSKLEVCFPEHQEQIAISKVLSDMDAEIEELERKLAKYKMIKQAMMQELLTGKKRLI